MRAISCQLTSTRPAAQRPGLLANSPLGALSGRGSARVVVCVGGWTIRNAVSLDHIQPITNNSGTLLAGANCERTYRGAQAGL